MKSALSVIFVLTMMVAIEPITDCLMLMANHWQPITCVLFAGAVWLVWCRYESKGEWK